MFVNFLQWISGLGDSADNEEVDSELFSFGFSRQIFSTDTAILDTLSTYSMREYEEQDAPEWWRKKRGITPDILLDSASGNMDSDLSIKRFRSSKTSTITIEGHILSGFRTGGNQAIHIDLKKIKDTISELEKDACVYDGYNERSVLARDVKPT